MKPSFVFLANGFEEIEALATVDTLRRAQMEVYTVSVHEDYIVTGAHGISVQADRVFSDTDFSDADWLIVPGGMPGATNLHEYEPLNMLLRNHDAAGKNIAAICAAPAVVLAPLGILDKKDATCYPGFEDGCRSNGAIMHDSPVIVSGNVVTGNGPASALRFALEIVRKACGELCAREVGSGMLYYPKTMNFYF